jgi:hypothetical protein
VTSDGLFIGSIVRHLPVKTLVELANPVTVLCETTLAVRISRRSRPSCSGSVETSLCVHRADGFERDGATGDRDRSTISRRSAADPERPGG